MERGTIFLVGEVNKSGEGVIDTGVMYTYLCPHPMKQLSDSFFLCSVCTSTDDTIPRLKIFKTNGSYTPIAKHENRKWVDTECEKINAIFNNQNFVEMIMDVTKMDPEMKRKLAKEFDQENIRSNLERIKMEKYKERNE